MAANARGAMRPAHANRTPSFIFIGLLVVIGILGFNYWNVTTKNSTLSRKLNDMTDRFRKMSVDKTTAESRFEELNKRLKECEHELGTQKTRVTNKDEEINSLTNQLNEVRHQLDTAVEEQTSCKNERDAAFNKQITFENLEATLRAEKQEKEQELQTCITEKTKLIEGNQHLNGAQANDKECQQVGDAVRLQLLKTVQSLFGDSSISALQKKGVLITGITLGTNPQGEVNLNQAVPQAQQQPAQAAGDAAPVQPAAPNQAAEGQAQDAQVQPPQPLQPQVQGAGDAPQQDANVPKDGSTINETFSTMAPNNTDNVTREGLPTGTVSVSPPVNTTGQTPEGDKAVPAADQPANPDAKQWDRNVGSFKGQPPALPDQGMPMLGQPPAAQDQGVPLQGQPPPMGTGPQNAYPQPPNAGFAPVQDVPFAQHEGAYGRPADREGPYPQQPAGGVQRDFGRPASLNEQPAGDAFHQPAQMNQDSAPGPQVLRENRFVDGAMQPPQVNQPVVSLGKEHHQQGPQGVNQGEAPRGVRPSDSRDGHLAPVRGEKGQSEVVPPRSIDDKRDRKDSQLDEDEGALKYEDNKAGEAKAGADQPQQL